MQYKPVINAPDLRKYYSKSLNNDVVLLTAHSHQAWLDILEDAQSVPVRIAHKMVDRKWGEIFGEIIPRFQSLIAKRINTNKPGLIANGENTHELVTRVLSCFPWNSSTKIVTTDTEFHSLKRQLYRLREEGVIIDFVKAVPHNSLTIRIIDSITSDTNIVILSSVFFRDGYILQDISSIINKAREAGATTILDCYHHFNIRKLYADELGRDIFITAGGYKYAGAGEGAAWLKIPENCQLKPKITGWFADFDSLEEDEYPFPVKYGHDANRFLGATRDMSGLYRQIAVLEFLDKMGMTVKKLEQNNLHQTAYLIYLYDELGLKSHGIELLSSRKDSERGAFLALGLDSSTRADEVCHKLWENFKVLTDTRGNILRIGPAPYTIQQELEYGMECLKKNIS